MPAADAAGSAAASAALTWHERRVQSLQALPVPLRELIAGGVAGGASKTCVAPLERCKILFQTGKIQPGSVVKTLQDIFRAEGVPGLFRGNGVSVLRIVPYSALYMGCYERYRRGLVDLRFMATHTDEGRVSPVVDLVAGSTAGATAVVATYPLDLVRTRLAFMTEGRFGGAAGSPGAGAAGGTVPAAAAAEPGWPAARGRGGGSAGGSGNGFGATGGFSRQLPRGGQLLPGLLAGFATAPRRLTLGMSHLAAPLAGAAPRLAAASARHSAAAAARRLHALNPPPLRPAASGGGGGVPATPIAARSLLPQLLPHHPHHSIGGVLRGTLRTEGLRGMYHGIGPSLYGILPYAGLKFYVYQHLKGRFHALWPERMRGAKANRLPVPVMLAYGAAAGLVAQTATYPLDVVRRRMQVEGLLLQQQQAQVSGVAALTQHPPQFVFRSTPQALIAIGRREGLRALFAGLSINYMKVVPSTAIAFTIYDYAKAHLDLPTNL